MNQDKNQKQEQYNTLEGLGMFDGDNTHKFFNCKSVPIANLPGRKFILLDFIIGVKTTNGDGRAILKCKLVGGEIEFKTITTAKRIVKMLEKLDDQRDKLPIEAEIEEIKLKRGSSYSYQFVDRNNRDNPNAQPNEVDKEFFTS